MALLSFAARLAALCACACVCTATAAASAAASGAPRPNILFFLVDDLGHAEVGFNRNHTPSGPTREVQTPVMDSLVRQGVRLTRSYVHKFCSPTRCAIQSGRAPIHVNVINADPSVFNTSDPDGGFAGVPRNMTGIASVLAGAGYKTHFAGKWDVGMATNDHTPVGRGYQSSLSYYHHANDYYEFTTGSCSGKPIKDLWNFKAGFPEQYGRPAHARQNNPQCTDKTQSVPNCTYEDDLFRDRVVNVIREHDQSSPLFMFWAPHIVHGPLQVPDAQYAKFPFIDVKARRLYHSMVNYVDQLLGDVMRELLKQDMWDNTLIVMSTDNGGPLAAGNNYVFRGGKFSNWEGGIRGASFVSGGFLPSEVRGTDQAGLVAVWDWYATFARLAGVDPTDHRARAAGLPAIDSLDVWDLISGVNATSPRTRVEIGTNIGGWSSGRTSGATAVGGLIKLPYKILLGFGDNYTINMAAWPGPVSPNASAPNVPYETMVQACGPTAETGCLYNIVDDPGEHSNIAAENPSIFAAMLAEMEEIEVYSPHRGAKDGTACRKATGDYDGFWGPFIFP